MPRDSVRYVRRGILKGINMPSQTIQWFPGHMAKTRRMITESLGDVDAVIEMRDARIPQSSKNPEIERLTAGKPRLILLNKTTLADPDASKKWIGSLSTGTTACILTDCSNGIGLSQISPSLKALCSEKLEKYAARGMAGRHIRAMVLGIPNVGKSSLINRLAGGKKAKVEDRPGVTRDRQWVQTRNDIDLLDMPGVLWPKFDDRKVGENLAMTGAIRDEILDTGELALSLVGRLRKLYPLLLAARYRLDAADDFNSVSDYELFELIGRKRGFLLSGAEIDTDRTANTLIDEFRDGKIGRITLELPRT